MNIPRLEAHRGYRKYFPENTLVAMEAAINAGACYVEFDIQLCRDGIPVLSHDANLSRTAGIDRSVMDMTLEELDTVYVGEQSRFGDKFSEVKIPKLVDVVELLKNNPQVKAFVEIKRASLKKFGVATVIAAVLKDIAAIIDQCIIISFDKEALTTAREQGVNSLGWVFEPWNQDALVAAKELAPNYLFTDYLLVPQIPEAFWQGSWQWVLYEINDPELALNYSAQGIELIETGAIGEMFDHPTLKRARCSADRQI